VVSSLVKIVVQAGPAARPVAACTTIFTTARGGSIREDAQ
jgi:hypothetical protein